MSSPDDSSKIISSGVWISVPGAFARRNGCGQAGAARTDATVQLSAMMRRIVCSSSGLHIITSIGGESIGAGKIASYNPISSRYDGTVSYDASRKDLQCTSHVSANMKSRGARTSEAHTMYNDSERS